MDSQLVKEIKLKDWNGYKKFVSNLTDQWIFRGQENAQWDLKTSYERANFDHLGRVEISFIEDFKRGATIFGDNETDPKDMLDWIALMQHHGAPTRFLDFTKSPYIASFFAFENETSIGGNIAIWGIDVYKLMYYLIEFIKENNLGNKLVGDWVSDQLVEEIIEMNNLECILPVEVFKMNRRYYLQQSIFLSSGICECPFMEQLGFINEGASCVLKIILSSEIRRCALMDLQKMNINKVSLFPSLDGYAKSLTYKYRLIKTIEEENEAKESQIKFFKNLKP